MLRNLAQDVKIKSWLLSLGQGSCLSLSVSRCSAALTLEQEGVIVLGECERLELMRENRERGDHRRHLTLHKCTSTAHVHLSFLFALPQVKK